jgi:hypothetical protein
MRSQLLSELSRSGRRRWLQVDETPFSRAINLQAYKRWVNLKRSRHLAGSRRDRRLIDGDSLDSYLESLTAKQVLAEVKCQEAA